MYIDPREKQRRALQMQVWVESQLTVVTPIADTADARGDFDALL